MRNRFDELLEQTLDADASVRLAAAEDLVAGGKDALPALVGALNREHNAIRHTAALTLGRMGDAARGAVAVVLNESYNVDGFGEHDEPLLQPH
jgi:HEAT repeat protein